MNVNFEINLTREPASTHTCPDCKTKVPCFHADGACDWAGLCDTCWDLTGDGEDVPGFTPASAFGIMWAGLVAALCDGHGDPDVALDAIAYAEAVAVGDWTEHMLADAWLTDLRARVEREKYLHDQPTLLVAQAITLTAERIVA